MARKHSFLGEIQRANKKANQQRQKAARQQSQAYAAAQRHAEQAARAAERAATQQTRSVAAEQKRAEQEAKRLHLEARLAEAEAMNAELASSRAEFESILESTLEVDDFLDLESLRVLAEHPPLNTGDLETPIPPPSPITAPPEPEFASPPEPSGLSGIFGKKRYPQQVEQARIEFEQRHAEWQIEVTQIPAHQLKQLQDHQATEHARIQKLTEIREQYEAEYKAREAEAAQANESLDELIDGLTQNDHNAVQQYVTLVLGNSTYPESVEVNHEHHYDTEGRELSLTVSIPGPNTLPRVKEYKYNKSTDQITAVDLTEKALKDQYAGLVYSVALRTVHEVFEADREGRIQSISLNVETSDLHPATGTNTTATLVSLAVHRDSFAEIDLANAQPTATLKHLKATVSKNPHQLEAVKPAHGVRTD